MYPLSYSPYKIFPKKRTFTLTHPYHLVKRKKEDLFMNIQEIINAVPWAIIAPILIIESILLIVALIDLIRNDNPNGPKWLWVIIILFINIIGPILYFIIGRRPQ